MDVHERELIQKIIKAQDGLIMDGTWGGFAEDSGVLSGGGEAYANLLLESRRVPEMVVVLKCSEDKSLKRLIDEKAIVTKFEDIEKKREELKVKKRAEDSQTKSDEKKEEQKGDEEMPQEQKDNELKEMMTAWNTERDELEKDDDPSIYPEDCPEKPVFQEMMDAAGQGIKDQRDVDEGFLAEFSEAIGARVPVIELNTDMTAEFVHIKLNAQLDKNLQMRNDLIERDLAQELTDKELVNYEPSYQYKQSKFGRCSPISLSNPVKSRDFAVLYRERIYYPADADERKMLMEEPSKYVKDHSMPLDIDYCPKICLLGLMKSGKTELAKTLSQNTKCVHLNMDEIV